MVLSARGSDEMLLKLTRNITTFTSLIFQMQDLLYLYVIKEKQMHNNILLYYSKFKKIRKNEKKAISEKLKCCRL